MKNNMGNADKIIRIIVALIIGGLYISGLISGTLAIILLAAAVIFVLTSIFSFCPLYYPFGIKTCKNQ